MNNYKFVSDPKFELEGLWLTCCANKKDADTSILIYKNIVRDLL